MAFPALALLEFSSIAVGLTAGDAMVKRAPIERILAGTVQPGHYLVLVTGDVASVEEAVQAGREVGQLALLDHVFLPNVHPAIAPTLAGERPESLGEAVGIIETTTVVAALHGADAGLKGAQVALLQLRLADGLGGKGLAVFSGVIAEVEAAVALAVERAQAQLLKQVIIPQLHEEMRPHAAMTGRFGTHYNWNMA